MKKIIILLILAFATNVDITAQYAEDWENPLVISKNRERARATLYFYPTNDLALKMKREASPWFKLLNGKWQFKWVKTPAQSNNDFVETGYDASSWDLIDVPSSRSLKISETFTFT